STSSLDSTTTRHISENGRRYHGFRQGRYLLPNDKTEQDRLDLQHHCFKTVFSSIHTAPLNTLKPLTRILDLGTGTGRWAIDLAYDYPSAKVTGVDLSPIQPSWIPPNCDFEIDDIESPWTVAPGSVDYIHARCLLGAVKDWPGLLAQVFTALRPGGLVEIMDVAVMFSPMGVVGGEYDEFLKAGMEAMGREVIGVGDVPGLLTAGGFVGLSERRGRIPIGSWPVQPQLKELGRMWRECVLAGLEGGAMATLTRGLGWSREDVEVLVGNLRREVVE
ncbi:S-adenosyl-L-methionine-dependent methyltransferase, partial [Wilcoxina mikolae CBS 423.85]